MQNASLYWLHLPEHKDIFSQGYIGVARDPNDRYKRHLLEIRSERHTNDHLKNAYKKYKNIIQTILVIGEEEYIYELELTLRPKENVGWNIAAGGNIGNDSFLKNNPMKNPEIAKAVGKRTGETLRRRIAAGELTTPFQSKKHKEWLKVSAIKKSKEYKGTVNCQDAEGNWLRVSSAEYHSRSDLIHPSSKKRKLNE